MYVANHYVRINGKVYIKGERVPDGLSDGKIRWLLDADAVHWEADPEDVEYLPFPEAVNNIPGEAEAEADDSPVEAGESDEGDEGRLVEDIDAEAPEIDVMAGIVQEKKAQDPEETPRRKSSTKRANERRKTK